MKKFPDNFLWGTAEDAYQHEGGNFNNDWYLWEQSECGAVKNNHKLGLGPDFYNRYEEDFSRAASSGQTIHRIGVEWSRIEPLKGVYNEEAIEHYSDMLRSLKSKGFKVILNIWHFTLPIWAANEGGFENDEILKVSWPSFVRLCARRFCGWVDLWSTVIDSQIYALQAYGIGDIPPGKNSIKLAFKMYFRMIRLHRIAYKIIKECSGNDSAIGQIYFFFDFYPASRKISDRLACKFIDNIFNWLMLKILYRSRSLDWLGINYYTRQIVKFDYKSPGFIHQAAGTGLEKSDMEWEIFPEGLKRICRSLSARFPEMPLHITECGIADEADSRRTDFIKNHLLAVFELINEGTDIRSFSYWSSIDNWEWNEGWGPKFGLYGWSHETLERFKRPSAEVYRRIVELNAVPDDL